MGAAYFLRPLPLERQLAERIRVLSSAHSAWRVLEGGRLAAFGVRNYSFSFLFFSFLSMDFKLSPFAVGSVCPSFLKKAFFLVLGLLWALMVKGRERKMVRWCAEGAYRPF